MTAAIGRGLVLVSLFCASAGAVAAFAAFLRKSSQLTSIAVRAAYGFAASMILANLWMVAALLRNDFSISYVAQVGSVDLPTWVKVVSLWSSLEGSILFWGFVLAIYIAVATRSLNESHGPARPAAIGVWLLCATFFGFLIAGPAQPFGAVANVPTDGPGPNPLLQNHVLMAIHPPFLYGGYVGMTIPFGLALAALLTGRLSPTLLGTIRTSLLAPWTFLTCAVVLGGWWAYEVLGWGGYWAWDPVENASLLPWLTATAALHSAILTERRGVLKGWTMSLVISSFLLTILGTFMTRSGIFNSVHSFTQSAIGPTILVFLGIATLASVVLLAVRVDLLKPDGELDRGASRDTAFLAQNLLLVLFTFTVLIGTVFPLIVEAARNVQMSVGRPYFDRMTIPIGALLLFVMGVGPALPWGSTSRDELKRRLLPPLGLGLVALALALAFGVRTPWTLITLFFAGYAAHVTLFEALRPARTRMKFRTDGWRKAFSQDLFGPGLRRLAAYVAHAGAVTAFIAIAVSSTRATSLERSLQQGETMKLGRYSLTFEGIEHTEEAHRTSTIARIGVKKDGIELAPLRPMMNQYQNQRESIGTPDVRTGLSEDLYLSVMNIDEASGTIGILALINPLVSWLWIATVVMAIGGLMALFSSMRVGHAAPATPNFETAPVR
ncbi:MAG: heme lyase CcmF/NrfE family subunit [Vicinamibacteria bacterium]|nr:heme lyase CcmF/NrfE family subunit [Vicinamibacteria bacterium]